MTEPGLVTRLRERVDELTDQRDAALTVLHKARRSRDTARSAVWQARKERDLWRRRYEKSQVEVRQLRKIADAVKVATQ